MRAKCDLSRLHASRGSKPRIRQLGFKFLYFSIPDVSQALAPPSVLVQRSRASNLTAEQKAEERNRKQGRQRELAETIQRVTATFIEELEDIARKFEENPKSIVRTAFNLPLARKRRAEHVGNAYTFVMHNDRLEGMFI